MSLLEIPKGWKLKKIGEISDIKRGISWSKSNESKIMTKNSLPVLRITNIRERNLDISELLYLSNLSEKQIEQNKVSKNDILLVGSNGNKNFVGRSCLIEKDMKFVFASFLMAIKNISDDVDPKFLLYYLNSTYGKNYLINSTSTGVGINNLKISKLREMDIIFPNKFIQKKIIQKLDYALLQLEEKKKEILELQEIQLRHISKLESDLHIDLIRKFIPLENRPPYWNIRKIHEIAEIGQGGTPSRAKSEYWNGNIPWLRSGEILNNRITESKEKITDEGLKKSSTQLCPKGTILMAMTGQGLTRGRTALLEIDACANQSCAHIINKTKDVITEFLWLFLQSRYWFIRSIYHGSGQPGINISLIKQLDIPIPPLKEQQNIIEKINDSRNHIESIKSMLNSISEKGEKMNEYFDHIKTAVLTQAFSGKLIN